ncbi:hypothetical protein CK501_08130 [Halovibrio salipaludis]|uniref:MobA-like NTP transferase domain-containing protein n=1 Tax=Halovibrio salipaludis TaxID=2032626 RepID=A0A2A2F4N1_9GAMM|nr:nucleotidyltransferase family protein [Halovibrio salipaludis]PAU80406.1 hypothetical protein CK501_08130 [Halovibrio salipaludis]
MPEPRSPRDGPAGTGVIALVMAAGASRRFGDADKRVAALPDGRTLLAATVESLRKGFHDVRVVIRSGDDPELLGLPPDIRVIRSVNAAHGMGSSIADAALALNRDPELSGVAAAAICLGDMPWIRHDTLARLTAAASESRILRPTSHGTPGHPVIFGRAFWDGLMSLEGDTGGRTLLRQYGEHQVPVDDVGIVRDVDNPDDLL